MSGAVAGGWTRPALVVGGVARRHGAVLLVHERTVGSQGPDQWVLPGGPVGPGELLDVALKREVEQETGQPVRSVGSLAFGTQHYAAGNGQSLLFLAFNVELEHADGQRFDPKDPEGLIIEARFVPVAEAIKLVRSGGVFPGSQSTADFLVRAPDSPPPIWLWDLNNSTEGPLAELPAS